MITLCMDESIIKINNLKIYTTLGYIVYIFIFKMFHQEASVETNKLKINKLIVDR